MKNILTIAGYDPSSGAGVSKDLDTFFRWAAMGFRFQPVLSSRDLRESEIYSRFRLDQFASMLKVIEGEVVCRWS